MNPKTRILVTGAGGFIGGWIVESLQLRGFERVRAGVRRWSSAARIGRFPVEIVLCNILDERQVAQAMEGVNVVVHCAIGSPEVMIRGTENVLKAALANNVERFIHFSTVDVYGDTEGEIDETTPVKITGKAYGNVKIEAEKLCRTYHERGVPVVVLRPSIVYGPYAKLWIAKFAERLMSGKWGLFTELGDGRCNLVYVTDVVNAVLLSIESDKAVGEAFNINGGDVITWNEYFSRLNRSLGLPPLHEIGQRTTTAKSALMVPVKAAAHFALDNFSGIITRMYQRSDVIRGMARRFEKSMQTSPSGDELAMYGRKPSYRIDKARRILGFEPSFNVDQGIDMSVRWLRHESLIAHKEDKV